MAEQLTPSKNILIGNGKEMTDFEITYQQSTDGGSAGFLFDRLYDIYSRTPFSWQYVGDRLKININKPCNLYIRLGLYYDQPICNGDLTITPNTYGKQYKLSQTSDWQLFLSNIQPGTYEFTKGSNTRKDDEWFFEEVKTYSKIVKDYIKEAIINNELIQKYVLTTKEVK